MVQSMQVISGNGTLLCCGISSADGCNVSKFCGWAVDLCWESNTAYGEW